MPSSSRALPPSPFGPPRPLHAAGWAFGVCIASQTRAPSLGFFIEPEPLAVQCARYAELVPGCSARDAFMALAVPSPVRRLLCDWRPDWRETGIERLTAFARSDEPRIEISPNRFGRDFSAQGSEEPVFAWIKASLQARLGGDEESDAARADICSAWRQELESRGLRTADWTGKSLTFFGNGLNMLDIEVDARAEAEAAFLRRALKDDLTAELAPGSGRPAKTL